MSKSDYQTAEKFSDLQKLQIMAGCIWFFRKEIMELIYNIDYKQFIIGNAKFRVIIQALA